MAQDDNSSGCKLETDGIIITNNVEVTTKAGSPNLSFGGAANRSASVRSHNISISSISDLESESSTNSLSGDYLTEMQRPDVTDVVQQKAEADSQRTPDCIPTKIASIAIKDSTDITFGNKTHYHGPVTIKQFMIDKGRWSNCDLPNGKVNEGFQNSFNSLDKKVDLSEEKIIDVLNKFPKPKKPLYKNYYLISTIACVIALIVIITFVILTATLNQKTGRLTAGVGDGDDDRKNTPIDSNIDLALSNSTSSLRIVTRDEWIAQPPNNPLEPLELPSLMVIITHTATDFCTTQAECTFRVRYIQTYHIESRNWDDIGYNFLVGGDGQIYEGRGWEKQGAHTKGYNRRSIGLAFIGTFNKIKPPDRQVQAAQLLIDDGVRLGKVDKNYKLYGHRQLIASESPGDELYNIIVKWPHWSNTTIIV